MRTRLDTYDEGEHCDDLREYDFRSQNKAPQSGPLPGWIYCIRNPSIPNQLKIGLTTQAVESRMKQLDTTGVATPFELVQKWLTGDVRRDEAAIHKMLSKYRTRSNREWFSIPEERTDQLLIHINKYIRSSNRPYYEIPTEMPALDETRWERIRGLKRLSVAIPRLTKTGTPKKQKPTRSNRPQGVTGFAAGVGYVVLGCVGIAVLAGIVNE